MKYVRFFTLGTLFGIVFTKSEVISWFRIQEMFLFHSIHMYGILATAILVTATGLQIIKRMNIKDIDGNQITLVPSTYRHGNLIGGIIFGLGWGMIGACPGPMFALLGGGILLIAVAILGALAGTVVFGLLEDRIPWKG